MSEPGARAVSVDLVVSAQPLDVPAAVDEAVEALRDVAARHARHVRRFSDDPCLIFSEPPVQRGGVVQGCLAVSSYFIKSVARGTVPARIAELLPADLLDAAQSAVAATPTDHPLRWPAAGLTLALRLATGEVVMVRRSLELSVNPGMWSATVAEGFSLDDIRDGRLDLDAAAIRGLREEIGLAGAAVSGLRVLGLTRVGAGIDGYNVLLTARTHLGVEGVRARHASASDGGEAQLLEAMPLAQARTLDPLTATTRVLLELLGAGTDKAAA